MQSSPDFLFHLALPNIDLSKTIMNVLSFLDAIPWSQVSVVVALLATYILGAIYRVLPPNASLKHAFNIIGSILLYSSLFGFREIPQLMISPLLIYIMGVYYRQNVLYPVASFAVAMGHVGFNHFFTQFIATSTVAFDGTAPLMVMVIKMTSFAWCLHDGTRPDKVSNLLIQQLTDLQKKLAVRSMPSLLEYFGYIFFFGGFLVGPAIEFQDYIEFSRLQGDFKNIPSGAIATLKCVAQGIACAAIFVSFEDGCNLRKTFDPEFMTHGLVYRLLYVHIACIIARTKYYIAWKLSEGVCNFVGIGYNGVNKTGTHLWNRVQNIRIRGFEWPENPKGITDSWNINTSRWLRNYVYFRLSDPKTGKSSPLATILTNMTSALWHGFYPGYYLFFGSASYFILVSRSARKHIRPFFVNTPFAYLKPVYDLAGVACTLLMCSYSMVPFVLKRLDESLELWTKLYFTLHLAYGIFYVSLEYLGGGSLCRKLVKQITLVKEKEETVDIKKNK